MAGVTKLVREPFLQFFVLGAGIFLLYGYAGGGDAAPGEIVVSAGQIDRLVDRWVKTRMRPPTAAELAGLIDDHIREEVYYREAVALGLDRDNVVIRRHLRQQMEFLSQDIAAQADATEEELRAFLEANAESFRVEPRFSFRHIYLSLDQRGDAGRGDAMRLLAELEDAGGAIGTTALGDPFPLPHDFESIAERDLSSMFGVQFAALLSSLEPGSWQGPVRSGYGIHLVFIREHTASRTPELAEVRDAVTREWRAVRRQAANAEVYRSLRERYTVFVETPEWLEDPVVAEATGR